MDFLEFPDALLENRGAMNQGRLKLTNTGIIFKNGKTGKVEQIQSSDIDLVNWQRLAGGFGLRVFLKSGQLYRFGGFKETDFEKLTKFFSVTSKKTVHEKNLSLKGWNWGTVRFTGSVLAFDVDNVTAYEIPLLNVSHCTTAKNEVTLEFHQNDDAAVSLMEMRFHITADVDQDTVEAFHDNVMQKASIIQATGDAIATFKEVHCLTPRGRYELKLFPSFIQLHGKTFDYKIPMTTVLRLFLLPHKDQRQMFFVVSLDPPIKQGQTRYHFLILQFNKEDEITLEMGIPEKEILEKYEGKLQHEMSGQTYEVMSKIMKALIQRKITVPGSFIGHSGTSAVSCSYRAAAGFMYPLERGFIYVHKPPIHIRFEEVASVNFARSGGSTRSFDFEVETRTGIVHTFSSIEKEEYNKLYDFVTNKKIRIKNIGPVKKKDQQNYNDEELINSDVEDEPDAYLARVKAEAEERDDLGVGGGDHSDDDESDESFNPGDSGSEVAEEYDSHASSSSSDDDSDDGAMKDKKREHKEKEKKSKKAKTVSETRKPRKKKKERDENKPKRPQSAYFLWLNESRESLKKEFPGISITDLSKRAGEKWKEIKDKTKWEKLAEEGKKVYEKDMIEYRKLEKSTTKEKSSTPVKKEKASTSSHKSPSKNSSLYKSKEYITSSEGSSDSEGEKKTKGKAEKAPLKKEVKDKKSEESEDDNEEKEEEQEDKEEDEEKDETKDEEKEDNEDGEESAGTTPATSEDDDDDD